MTQNFDANSTNVTEVRTNELTNIRTDERKGKNYTPVGINAGGIKKNLGGGGGGGSGWGEFRVDVNKELKFL